MSIEAKAVKELRDRTGLPMMQCKRALEETSGDLDKAEEHLRKQGAKMAEKRAHRETAEGVIGVYLHHDGKTGVMVELDCETESVARTEDFQSVAKDLAMHVAFHDPVAVRREEVPAEAVEKEKEIIRGQLEVDEKMRSKPDEVKERIAEGKIEQFFAERVLMEQPFVKDTSGKTKVKQLVQELIQKTGENVTIRRFARFKVGE